jgi:hypothetical protein
MSNRPMFRFTIRDVLWLTALVAVACGWAMEVSRNRVERREFSIREAEFREKLDIEKRRADRAERVESRVRYLYELIMAAEPNP